MRDQHYQHIDPTLLYEAAAKDLETFRDLAGTYLEIAPPMLARLEQAILDGNPQAISHESHALKGTTSLVGAARLSEQLKEVEVSARRGEVEAIAPRMAEIRQLFDLVALEVQKSITHFRIQEVCDVPSEWRH